ncbi:replication initiation protein, partial [Aerococcus viridans]
MKKIDEKLAAEISQKKPAVSNSRLGSQKMGKLEISIDRITVVGDLKKDQSKNLNRELKFNSYVQLYETGEERFKADIPNICHVEYDFLKGKSLDRKNMRVEFNPNNLNDEHKQMIYDLFISKMVSRSFSRLDVAFDTDIDLSSYYAYMDGQHAQMKKTIFYGKDGSPETKYFGTRKSDRYIRVYN